MVGGKIRQFCVLSVGIPAMVMDSVGVQPKNKQNQNSRRAII